MGSSDFIATVALFVSIASAVFSRRSAEAAERQAHAAERSVPPRPALIAWEIEHRIRNEYFLRHIGTVPAKGVRTVLPEGCTTKIQVSFPSGSIKPGEGVSLTVVWRRKEPTLHCLPLVWDGRLVPVQVPFPNLLRGQYNGNIY